MFTYLHYCFIPESWCSIECYHLGRLNPFVHPVWISAVWVRSHQFLFMPLFQNTWSCSLNRAWVNNDCPHDIPDVGDCSRSGRCQMKTNLASLSPLDVKLQQAGIVVVELASSAGRGVLSWLRRFSPSLSWIWARSVKTRRIQFGYRKETRELAAVEEFTGIIHRPVPSGAVKTLEFLILFVPLNFNSFV